MSSRADNTRRGFAAAMRKQEGSAVRGTPVTPRRVAPLCESPPKPSHPAFDRLEEMRTKQLEEVSIYRSRTQVSNQRTISGLPDAQEGVQQTP